MMFKETGSSEAAAMVWCLLSAAALVHLNLVDSAMAATNQQPNATSIDHSNLFHNHHHHHHHHHLHDNRLAPSAATCSNNQIESNNEQHSNQQQSLSSSLLRTYIRINNMRAYHLDLHAYRPEAKFVGDPVFVDSRSEADRNRCRRHLGHFQQLLRAFHETDPMEMSNSIESIRLADTFGRPMSGLLDGNQFWLGSYERCLDFKTSAAKLADESSARSGPAAAATQHIQGQYCLGLSQFPSWNPIDSKTSIKIGMCLPETCTSSMLNEERDLFQMVEKMMSSQLGEGLPFSKLKLRSIYCLPHETSEIRQYTWSSKMLISVMSLFVVACIYATISDYLASRGAVSAVKALTEVNEKVQPTGCNASSRVDNESSASGGVSNGVGSGETKVVKLVPVSERTWRNIIIESFSIIQNVKKLTKLPSYAEPDESSLNYFNKDLFFAAVTGIKCVGLLWIIAAHTFLVGPIPSSNLIQMDQITKTYLANVYLSAHLLVDSFFVLSGLLASYMIFKHGIDQIKLRHWIVMTIHRYWRLTPIYLLCYWYAKSLGHLNSSGPLWDYMTGPESPRLNCLNESWLTAIFQMSDFKSPKNHCVPFAWFIANGIKFWIVTPLFLVAIYKSVRRGYALVMGAIVANCALVFLLVLNSSVDMKSVIEFKPESADNMLNDMEDIYTRPYSRIGAYLVGLLAGHWFYTLERDQKRLNMSDKTKYLLWSLVSATMFFLVFVVKITGDLKLDDAAIPWVFSAVSCIIRPIWALCTCWLVFALAHGQARWLANFLCARSWSLLARVSFTAYLVQGEVIASTLLAVKHSSPFVYSDLISKALLTMVATIAAAILMTIIVECPLIGIEELLLPPKRPVSRAKGNLQADQMAQPQDKQPTSHNEYSASHEQSKGTKLKSL